MKIFKTYSLIIAGIIIFLSVAALVMLSAENA